MRKIQKRLIAVVQNLENRPKQPKYKPYKISKSQLYDSTQHEILHSGSRITCIQCKASLSRKSPQIENFLKAPCIPFNAGYAQIIPIGKQFTHPSHNLQLNGGVFLCITCGGIAREVIHKLSDPCSAPTPAGKYNLRAYELGNAPKSCPDWPYNSVQLIRQDRTQDQVYCLALARTLDDIQYINTQNIIQRRRPDNEPESDSDASSVRRAPSYAVPTESGSQSD